MEKCKICGKEFKSFKGGNFTVHLQTAHTLTTKEYYDKFLKSEDEENCDICNKPTKFLSINLGYRQFCRECSYKESGKKASQTKLSYTEERKQEIKLKREETVMKKFGVRNFLTLDEIQEKSHSKEARQKAVNTYKQTMVDNYGVDNYFKTTECREKCQIEEAKAKRAQTFLNTTGVNSPRKINGVEEKIKATNMERYNCESYIEYSNNIGLTQDIKNKNILEFECKNNCTEVTKLIDKFGQGWYKANIVNYIYDGPQRAYVKNSDIQIIEKYSKDNLLSQSSIKEQYLKDYIMAFYTGIMYTNNRSIISPYELDVYLPEKRLAIEFNGTYYHSIEKGTPKDYHLNKSLLCRELDIRLIHIYEFENFKKQLKLLKDLILGIDNYPIFDFNKNNLIEQIPEPVIIFNNMCTVYGAGKLY